jgi:hypothetical protein
MSKYINLIWRIPVAIIGGGLGYYGAKFIAVLVLSSMSVYMSPRDITLMGTWVPLVVPITFGIWAIRDFIFPPKPPAQPPIGGGYMQ